MTEAKQLIETNPKIVFLKDLFEAMGIERKTFEYHIDTDSNEYDEIKSWIDKNKTSMKQEIRDRLLESNNVTALIALYKLLGDKDERAALNNHKTKEEQAKTETEEITLEIQWE